jgi:hypothetical protein
LATIIENGLFQKASAVTSKPILLCTLVFDQRAENLPDLPEPGERHGLAGIEGAW